MSSSKRYWIIALAVVLALAAGYFLLRPAPGQGTYDNLIVNGDFARSGEGMASGWYTEEWFHQPDYTVYEVTEADGFTAAHIRSLSPNDARFAQEVAVSPNTLYCLRGFIKAQAEGGRGANLSIAGDHIYSDCVYESGGQWQEVFLFGRTGENQHSVTVFARLGGYSGEAEGEAWFRDVTLNRVDKVPAGYTETLWYRQPASDGEERASTGALPLILFCLLWAGLAWALIRFIRKESPLLREEKPSPLPLLLVLALALGVRIAAALAVPGYDVDIGCFRSWAAVMAEGGPGKFYADVSFCDYPPGYLWVLWALGGLAKLFGTGVTEFMVKLPPILADAALCACLYQAAKKETNHRAALGLTLFYALNPLLIVTGAAWGQADGVMILLLFLTVLCAVRGKWKFALPLYLFAVLVKPQALMFGPLGLLALILHAVKAWKDPALRSAVLKDAGMGLGLLLAVFAVFALPFTGAQSANWLFTLYGNTMSQYAYAAVNSCNLYFLLGKNWVAADTSLAGAWYIPALIYLPCALPLLPGLIRSRGKDGASRARPILLGGMAAALAAVLTVFYAVGALTYASLGTVMVVYWVAMFSALYWLGGDIKNLPLFGAGLLLMLFNTASRMHERYLVPAIALLLLSYALKRDRRILLLTALVTAAGFLNVGCALDRNIRIGGAAGHLNAPAVGIASDLKILEYLSALGNYLSAAAALMLCEAVSRGDIPAKDAPEGVSPAAAPVRSAPLPLLTRSPHMTGRDWAILLCVTALYAVLAFVNLGSFKAPQTEWQSGQAGQTVQYDLGEEKTFSILYYPGIQHNAYTNDVEMPTSFSASVSRDGQIWENAGSALLRNGDCFKWLYLAQSPVEGRYVRIEFNDPRMAFFEILLRDSETGQGIAALSLTDSLGGDPAALNDELDTLEGEPGWYNSTYFDEIYHARTAYEHLHGLYPYETTHPPLGKVMMSWCVAIFGMVPFGWRFAGALAGVLMLPGMYLLGKLLIRRKWGGAATMLLMALDLMHFTQTRIATIDSFVVLFIIWMTYFMLRWFFLDFWRLPFWKTLIPLGLSGLMMGLGVASKWTGCYAGVGLAIIFFLGVWRRYREVRQARSVPVKKRTMEEATAAGLGAARLLITMGSCLLFFVAVPLLIYYLSYIPYFAPSGGVTVNKIIQAAQGMLWYHSQPGLGMTHDFYSPWYQWPIIGKPMWYYSSAYEPAGYQSSITAMGNPAVWWTGLAALAGVICVWAARHYDREDRALCLHTRQDDPRWALLMICFFAQFLPWMLVPRGTYIYHYFPSVPFIILCTALCLDRLSEKWEKAARIALIVLLIIAAALFIAFFPYASGVNAPQAWMDKMKWFPRWLWY